MALPAEKLLVALYGPTSSGKTKLSVEVALRIQRELGREPVVISADSRQVYRYMDVGTSKTTREEMRGIRHVMLDVTEPNRKLELEDYAKLARGHIDECFSTGAVPFIVGGTGIYVSALLENWETDQVGAARESIRRDFPRNMARDAYQMLKRLDPAAASRVHPNNYEAIVNTLASAMSGASRSRENAGARQVLLGLDPRQRALDERVAATYDHQVRNGLFDEIRALEARYDLDAEFHRHGADSANQVLHTHGYREYFEHAASLGKPVDRLTSADLAEVRVQVIAHIQAYTRRQRGWFQKLPPVSIVKSPGHAFSLVAGR